jgi:hypothetical protein
VHATTSPLWTEYVSAGATVVGVIIALVALTIARRSSRSAAESETSAEQTANSAAASAAAGAATQEAAEGQLKLAREEHDQIEADRARSPKVDVITPSEIHGRAGEAAPLRTIRIGFTNSGDRALEDGLLTILLDPGSEPELTNRWGTNAGEDRDDETIERWPGARGVPRAFDYFARPLRVPAGVSIVRYIRVAREGRFPLRVKLFSVELEGDGLWADAAVVVDERGNARVENPDAENGTFAGRDSEFAEAELEAGGAASDLGGVSPG